MKCGIVGMAFFIAAVIVHSCVAPEPPRTMTHADSLKVMRKELQRAIDSVNRDTCHPMPQCVDPVPGKPK